MAKKKLIKLRERIEIRLLASMPANFVNLKFDTWEKGYVHGEKHAYEMCLDEIDKLRENTP